MKKRIIALLLGTALAVTLLAGCGKKADETKTEPSQEAAIEKEEETDQSSQRDEGVEPETYYGGYWCASYYADEFNVNPDEVNSSVTFTYAKKCAGSCYVTFTETGYETVREAIDSFLYTSEDTEESDISILGRQGIRVKLIENDTTKSASGLAINNEFMFLEVSEGVLVVETFETVDPDESRAMAISDSISGIIDSIDFAAEIEDIMPLNMMEERIQKTEFSSYDEVIENLEKGEAYGYVKVAGADYDVLMIAMYTSENDGVNYATEVYPYVKTADGTIVCAGVLISGGESLPIAVSEDGYIMCAADDTIEKDCIDSRYGALVVKEYHYLDYNDEGSAIGYGGFVREDNFADSKTTDIEGNDPYYFEKAFEDYSRSTFVTFTVVE